jgi:hypothetical protein
MPKTVNFLCVQVGVLIWIYNFAWSIPYVVLGSVIRGERPTVVSHCPHNERERRHSFLKATCIKIVPVHQAAGAILKYLRFTQMISPKKQNAVSISKNALVKTRGFQIYKNCD